MPTGQSPQQEGKGMPYIQDLAPWTRFYCIAAGCTNTSMTTSASLAASMRTRTTVAFRVVLPSQITAPAGDLRRFIGSEGTLMAIDGERLHRAQGPAMAITG